MEQSFLSRLSTFLTQTLALNYFQRLAMHGGILFLGLIITACSVSVQPTPTETANPQPTATATFIPLPTVTPTPLPLGIDTNPLILGIVSETSDPKALAAASQITKSIQQLTGYVITARSYPSYDLLVSEMSVGKVHIAFLPPLTYLYAKQLGFANVELLTNHFGVYQYGSRFFANVASHFQSYYDPNSDRATADAVTALTQLKGKIPCWVDSTSPSGYVVPMGIFKGQNIELADGAFLASPVGVIRALYITGICDFGVTFSTTGDPRTSTSVTQDLTDVLNRVVIIWQTDPIIPNLNLSFHPSIQPDMRDDLIYGFRDLLKDDTGKAALSTASNYEILDFKQVDDTIYDPLRALVRQTGLDLLSLVGR
jgi:phosphonate transport system substrate-binding protein